MKKMTQWQIEELNELLKEHGETLTAFYDEGISFGRRQVLSYAISGVFGLAGIVSLAQLIHDCKECYDEHRKNKEYLKKKTKEEEP